MQPEPILKPGTVVSSRQTARLRIEQSTISRHPSALQSINHLLGNFLVRNNHCRLAGPPSLRLDLIRKHSIPALLPDAVGNLDQIRTARLSGVDNDSSRVRLVDEIQQSATVGLQRVRGGPDDADGMIRVLSEEGEAGGNAGAGTDDDDGGEEAGAAHDTELGSAAGVNLLGRLVDDLAGPVSGVGNDNGEALVAAVGEALDGFAGDGALLISLGGGDGERMGNDAEGMGFFEGSIGEADGLAEVHFTVVKVKLYAVGGENFSLNVAETHA